MIAGGYGTVDESNEGSTTEPQRSIPQDRRGSDLKVFSVLLGNPQDAMEYLSGATVITYYREREMD